MRNKTLFILLLAMVQLSAAAQQRYLLDIKKSKILWTAPKTAGHGHYGYVYFNSGFLDYAPTADEPVGGAFSLNMTTISSTDNTSSTVNQRVDEELKGTLFLATDKYPAADITVLQLIKVTPTTYKVRANLTLKGITNPIEFRATITKKGNMVNATTIFTIDRTRWNIGHQAKTESWNLFAAVKDKALDNDAAMSLQLVFHQ